MDVMLCSQVEVHWRFGGNYCLHLEGLRVRKVSSSIKTMYHQ
jgi:hypothetical protein